MKVKKTITNFKETMSNYLGRLINIGCFKSQKNIERKRIKILNFICWFAILEILFSNIWYSFNDSHTILNVSINIIGCALMSFCIYLQSKSHFIAARSIFIALLTIILTLNANIVHKGFLEEYDYLLLPFFGILFFDNKKTHYLILIYSIGLFYIPHLFIDIYPDTNYGNSTPFMLFLSFFAFTHFFKDLNKKNENELKELNEFQKHFFVNITHESRTPLTLIKGNVLVAKKMDSIPNIQEKLDNILIHSNKIEKLINDIIDVTKAEANTLALNLEPCAINQVIQKQYVAFKSLFEDKEINFSFVLFEKNVTAEIDTLYFERVIGNVLVNAAKYTPEGGNVTISITADNNQIQIDVEDNGIGIASGEKTKIFNRFYQVKSDINKASGSGIGLAFCKEVIQLLKGDIVAFQNEYGGATFRITLPEKQPITTNINSTPNIRINTTKPTLLLVDDNIEMREYISSLLTDYNIIEASNGVEALEILETQSVNALITDYMMPVMDGYELIKQVKDKKYSFPILVITARADVKSKLDVLALGIDDYLTKPFVEEELVYRLQHSLLNAKNRTKYQKEEFIELPEEENLIEENELLLKSRLIIEENIGNPLFGIPDLVKALNLTERTLYRKIKIHSGLSPNQFIREIKLLYVRNLVEQNNFTSLIQLTQKVGLKNTSHLQKLYKERFGTTISS